MNVMYCNNFGIVIKLNSAIDRKDMVPLFCGSRVYFSNGPFGKLN